MNRRLLTSRQVLLGCALGAWLISARVAMGGPPYVTDDPEPVDPQHFELNIAIQYAHDSGGSSGSLPRTELNYGLIENVQVGLAIPLAFDDPDSDSSHIGLGDIELSVKLRFIQETPTRPMVAFFPSISLDTGDPEKNLGSGKTGYFLPLWFQKSWDQDNWTTFGGGGWTYNPAGQNFWRFGWALQRQVTDELALGGELFFETADSRDADDHLAFNLTGIYDVNDHLHLQCSAGRDIDGPTCFSSYVGIQITW